VGKLTGAFCFFLSYTATSTAIGTLNAPLYWGVFASGTATERRGYNSRRTCGPGHAFFQPLPLPSGVSAGAYSGVRSTSSVTPSNSGSISDFS
jgi:hypothetical protein